MEVSLKVTAGKNAGQEIRITGPKFYIGRADDCQLRPGSDLISRHHCVLIVEEGFVSIRDFGSKNGTFINGQRVAGECEIKPGDMLTVGHLEFELCFHGELSGQKRPKVKNIEEAAARTAQSVPKDELDISQWVDEEAAGAETRRMGLHESDTVEVEKTGSSPLPPAETVTDESTTSTTHDRSQKQAKPGKLPPQPNHSTDTSRDAAADALRQFFKRR